MSDPQAADELRRLETSPGWARLAARIDEEIREHWEEFMALPADRKTGKIAHRYQERYLALKWLKGLPDEMAKPLEFEQRRGRTRA